MDANGPNIIGILFAVFAIIVVILLVCVLVLGFGLGAVFFGKSAAHAAMVFGAIGTSLA